MPRAKRIKRVLVYNLTNQRLRVYFKSIPIWKLRIVVLEFPEEDWHLNFLHNKTIIEPRTGFPIKLIGNWEGFNGIVIDVSRVKGICLKSEETTDEKAGEHIVKITQLIN